MNSTTPRLALLALTLCFGVLCEEPLAAKPALPRSTPEKQGIASSAILGFLEEAEAKIDALHSIVIVRHGQVVTEGWWAPYGRETTHELYSLSKSFTSTAVGMAVAEGRMSIDDTVISFFPDDAPANPSANLKAMRVRDLLCMSTGHQTEPPTGPDKVCAKSFLAHEVPFKPGTRFLYNTAATFMLSAIVQKATGQTVAEYLKPRLFEPLGISKPVWDANFQGISLGGYGLNVRTEDIASFGQLYLQRGKWNGKQLIPASWVDLATSKQTSNGSSPTSDWDQGYGFQFWRCRNGAYRGDGAFGQYCIVMPQQDAVIAITSGLGDMQAVLNLVWDRLLPAMQAKPLRADPGAAGKLADKLAALKLPPVKPSGGEAVSPTHYGKTFQFPPNEQQLESVQLTQDQGARRVNLRIRVAGKDQTVSCGQGEWVRGRFTMGQAKDRAVGASGAWMADDLYVAKLCLYETPYILTLKLRFAGDQLTFESEQNVAFGARSIKVLGEFRK